MLQAVRSRFRVPMRWMFSLPNLSSRNMAVGSTQPLTEMSKARVFRSDSPPTRSRRSIGSGGESSSMLTSVEGNAVQAFSKGNNFLPHCVVQCWRFSLDDVHTSYCNVYDGTRHK
jgi:hypothetical protein